VPSRDAIDRAPRRVIRPAGGLKAELALVDLPGGRVAVKDYARRPWWTRVAGRWLIANEYRAYRHLTGVEGVPSLIGRIDPWGLAIEWIDGELLATAPDRLERGVTYVGRLRTVMDGIHATGLAHLDLRSNKNVLLARDGRIVVLDFGTAIRLRPGGWAHRVLFEFLRLQDRSGYLKWKRTLEAGPLTEEELGWLKRHSRVRPLWRFNRKRRPPD
jgi:hypothetical protein